MSPSNMLMGVACLLFAAAGIVTYIETSNWKVSTALICIGVANALLLWEASA